MSYFIEILKKTSLACLKGVGVFFKQTYFYKKFSTKYLPSDHDKGVYKNLKELSDEALDYFSCVDMGQAHLKDNIMPFHRFVYEIKKEDYVFLNNSLEKKKTFFVEACDDFGGLMAKHLFVVDGMPHIFKVYPDLDRNNNDIVNKAEKSLNDSANNMMQKFSEFVKAGKIVFANGVVNT